MSNAHDSVLGSACHTVESGLDASPTDPPTKSRAGTAQRPIDVVRELISGEMERHRQAIADTWVELAKNQFLHNSLAPVNALPPELLGTVFANLVSPGDLRSRGTSSDIRKDCRVDIPRGSRDILRVAQVCKQWRAVALENPALWTSLAIHHRGFGECLARSESMPVSLSLTDDLPPNLIRTLAQASHRVRSLYISTADAEDLEQVWRHLKRLPLLEELHLEHRLRTKRGRLNRDRNVGSDPFPKLSTMANGIVPSLRVLNLRGIPLPFPAPATLVHLEIVSNGTTRPFPSFSELLSAVESCPLLETLRLFGGWNWEEFQHHRHVLRSVIPLPRLASLSLLLHPAAANGDLLASLALPEHTSIQIFTHIPAGNVFGEVLENLRPPGSESLKCFQGIRRLVLCWKGLECRMQAFQDPDAYLDPPSLDMLVQRRSAIIQPEWWQGFFGSWPFDVSLVKTLVLVHEPSSYQPIGGGGLVPIPFVFGQWGNMFSELPALKTVRVIGLLGKEVNVIVEKLGGVVFCPNLTSLELLGIRLSKRVSDALVKFANRRAGEHSRRVFRRIELFSCKLDEEEGLAEKLGECGVEVSIDE